MSNLDNSRELEKKSKVIKKSVKRTMTLERDSNLNMKIKELLDYCYGILNKRKVSFADLVEVAIAKVTEEELEALCDKYRSGQDQLSESINALVKELGGGLKKEEVFAHLASQNLKKLCKDILKS